MDANSRAQISPEPSSSGEVFFFRRDHSGEFWQMATWPHPGRLTWNLQITHLERKMIFQASMIMVHVNLPGCTMFFSAKSHHSSCRVRACPLVHLWRSHSCSYRFAPNWEAKDGESNEPIISPAKSKGIFGELDRVHQSPTVGMIEKHCLGLWYVNNMIWHAVRNCGPYCLVPMVQTSNLWK